MPLEPRPPNDQSYDLAAIRFDDDGDLADREELTAALACIEAARRNPNGAVVVLFVHGWHHGSAWDDAHFVAFREVLKRLSLREAERYPGGTPGGRRVCGLHIAWNGDPTGWWFTRGPLRHASFWNRYKAAGRIGGSPDLRRAIAAVVASTKAVGPGPPDATEDSRPESPLILIGHSMGALIVESAFNALLQHPAEPLIRDAGPEDRPVRVTRAGARVTFPDVVLAVNSAADSSLLKSIRKALAERRFAKTMDAGAIHYSPPLLISATATGDRDTRVIWRLANLPWLRRRTSGHDPSLFTHTFQVTQQDVACHQRGEVDHGQNWHCVRAPIPSATATPSIPIDLPTRARQGGHDTPPFARYELAPLHDPSQPELTWVFQLPPEVVADHNDIFNFRAASLMLALIQLSGAVMSLATDLEDTFEA